MLTSALFLLPVAPFPAVLGGERADGGDTGVIEEVLVVGSRRSDLTAVESKSPVTVVSGARLRERGGTDMLDLLRDSVPSFSVNAQPIADGATIVRPPNIRNLAADHTLVLVNGKRRHRGAVIAWLVPKASEGAQGPDLSVIPAIALERVEVLADGASAQYGSDAVAGVINFVLRDASDGASFEVRYGQTSHGDGENATVAVNRGFRLCTAGFLNVSLEYGAAGDTVRSVQRADAEALSDAGNPWIPDPAQIWGSPKVKDNAKAFVNLGLWPTDRVEVYAFGNFASKTTDGGFYYRNPNSREGVYTRGRYRLVGDLTGDGSGGCPRDLDPEGRFYADGVFQTAAFARSHPGCFVMNELFPGGFTPRFGGDTLDYSAVAGLRGDTASGLTWDLSAGTGTSDVDFFIANTVNAALGPANPADSRFDPGDYVQRETGVNLDMAYAVNIRCSLRRRTLHSARSGATRRSGYAGANRPPGSARSPGRACLSTSSRRDLRRRPTGFRGSARIRRASGPGRTSPSTSTRKPTSWSAGRSAQRCGGRSTRMWAPRRMASCRPAWCSPARWRCGGTVSTGFRVPTPGQANAINATSKLGGQGSERLLSVVATIAPTGPVGQTLGGDPLKPERSISASAGLVYDSSGLTGSADCFRIKVRDRLALSRDIELNRPDLGHDRIRSDLIAQLENEGLTSARSWNYINYFTNDFTTVTQGCEASARYRFAAGGGFTTVATAFNRTRTWVDRYTAGGPLDDAREIRDYEAGLPDTRFLFSITHSRGAFDLSAGYSYVGDWYDSEENLDFDGYGAVDAAVSYALTAAWTLTLAVENLLDETPERNPNARTGLGNLYSQYAPAGFNGRFALMKLAAEF